LLTWRVCPHSCPMSARTFRSPAASRNIVFGSDGSTTPVKGKSSPVALRTNWTLLLKSRSRLSIATLRALDSFDPPTLRAWGTSLIGFPPLLGLAATADSSLAIPAARSGASPGSSSNSSTPAAVVRLSGQSQGVVKRQGVSVKVEGEVSGECSKKGAIVL
jgi:hypothetical protein